MPSFYLEIFVVVLGLVLLMFDAFTRLRKDSLAFLGIFGLGSVLLLLMFATDCKHQTIWGIYHVDHWAHFYKGIALVTTILVLIMSLDYKSVLKQYTSQDPARAGLGEFYCLPLFACAGLMWMASATDLITIFVALELVTMSSYVLVTYMRRNVGSLEAGVKYLILGALSTGFLVYGITWTFGITGETDLAKIGAVLASGDVPKGAAVFAFALLMVGTRVQGGCRAVPDLGARRLPGCRHADHRIPIGRIEGGGVHRAHPRGHAVHRFADRVPGGGAGRRTRRRQPDLRQPRSDPADQPQAPARLLQHLARRISC